MKDPIIRSDELDRKIDGLDGINESIADLGRRLVRERRIARVLAISISLDILLTIGLSYMSYGVIKNTVAIAKQNHLTITKSCEAVNSTNVVQLNLWTAVLANPQVASVGLQTQFQPYVEKAFARRDCQ